MTEHGQASDAPSVLASLVLRSKRILRTRYRTHAAAVRLRDPVKGFAVERRIVKFLAGHMDDIRLAVATPRPGAPSEPSPRVYVYWAQGIAQAPPLVQLCYQQLMTHHDGDDVVLLDDTNLPEFVDLPDYVWKKIGPNKTILSDIIRLDLLSTYGGVWVDATCLMRTNAVAMMPLLLESGFFAFTREDRPLASWFLASEPNDYIVRMWREAHCVYWRHYDKKMDYFLTHHLFAALCQLDEEFRARWAASTTIRAEAPHGFQRAMAEPYEPERFRSLLSQSFVHKLTYKADPTAMRPGTLLTHLLDHGPPTAEPPWAG